MQDWAEEHLNWERDQDIRLRIILYCKDIAPNPHIWDPNYNFKGARALIASFLAEFLVTQLYKIFGKIIHLSQI